MKIYRALLRLYPSSFRAEYGEEMCAIFASRQEKVHGAPATAELYLEALLDIS